MTAHPRLTHLGDVVDLMSQWLIAIAFWVCAAAGGAVLGVLGLLFVLNLIGRW